MRTLHPSVPLDSRSPEGVRVPARPSLLHRLLRQHPAGALGALIVSGYLTIAIFAGRIAPFDPLTQRLEDRGQPPSRDYLLGTDHLGRDVFSRIVHGSRVTLAVGVVAVAIGAGLGVIVGLTSGYFGGWADTLLVQVVDILLAFPLYLMALAIIAFLGSSVGNVILAVGIASFPAFARITRGEALRVRGLDFVEASRAFGAADGRLLTRHILPNIISPIIVMATLRVGYAILIEAGLSVLGLGIPPPWPSWGGMINQGMRSMGDAPWVATFPGLAIMGLVLGLNLLGDALGDVIDPRLSGAR